MVVEAGLLGVSRVALWVLPVVVAVVKAWEVARTTMHHQVHRWMHCCWLLPILRWPMPFLPTLSFWS